MATQPETGEYKLPWKTEVIAEQAIELIVTQAAQSIATIMAEATKTISQKIINESPK